MLVSVIAEKSSTKLAALLGGLPSTILIALFFIGLNEGPHFAAKAVIVTPVTLIIDAFYMLFLAAYAKKGYFKSLGFLSLCWAILVGLIVAFKLRSYPVSLGLWAVGLLILISVANKILPAKTAKLSGVTFSRRQLLARSVFSGSVIAFSVIISRYSGPIVGGIFTAFPAVYLSTFTILYFARGLQFSQAAIKPLIISGSINVIVYGLAVYALYPRFGIYRGTIMAFIVSLLSSFYGVRYILNYLTNKSATLYQ